MSEMIESFPVHPWPDPWGNLLLGELLYHAEPLGMGECPIRFYWTLTHPASAYYFEEGA